MKRHARPQETFSWLKIQIDIPQASVSTVLDQIPKVPSAISNFSSTNCELIELWYYYVMSILLRLEQKIMLYPIQYVTCGHS